MASDRPRILLVWGYHRKGWVEVFNRLAPHFRFELLFHLEQPESDENFTDFPVHYWLNFSSAKAIIRHIQPDKVVFMSTDGLPSTALNAACKRRGIPTVVMQHGMFQPYENYLLDEQLQLEQAKKTGKATLNKPNTRQTNIRLMQFYLRSFGMIDVFGAVRYFLRLRLLRKKYFLIEALRLLPSPLRLADHYVVFTRYNAAFFEVRDGVQPHQFIETGNPEFDTYTPDKLADDGYYLYLHSPLTYIPEYDSEGFMSQEEENRFLEKLNAFALSVNCLLYVKLHPYSYGNTALYRHPNLVYFKDADNAQLIMRARGVFGFNSTLILAATYFKPTCLFTLGEFSHVQEDLESIGVATLLPFHTFTPEELAAVMERKLHPDRSELLRRYLYAMDGKALERLQMYLSQP